MQYQPVDQDYLPRAHGRAATLINKMFSSVHVNGMDTLKKALSEQPVIFVSNHRSHLDYIIEPWVTYTQADTMPQIVAGDNLFTPTTRLFLNRYGSIDFRAVGSITINRKDYVNDPNYTRAFDEQAARLYAEGNSLLLYGDNGRQEKGKFKFGLRPIDKKGLLKIPPIAAEMGKTLVVPISISYDMTPETEKTHALIKNKKERATKKGLARQRAILEYYATDFYQIFGRFLFQRPHGEVHVNFGDPMEINPAQTSVELGPELRKTIAGNLTVTGTQLTALALKGTKSVTEEDLGSKCQNVYEQMLSADVNLSRTVQTGDMQQIIDDAFRHFSAMGVMEFGNGRFDISSDPDKQHVLFMNANYARQPLKDGRN